MILKEEERKELEYWQAEDRQTRIKEGRKTTKKVLESLKKKYPCYNFSRYGYKIFRKK